MRILPRRPRALLPTLAVLIGLIIFFSIFTNFWTELLWYRSVGYAGVFRTRLVTRLLLFLVFGLIMGGAVAGTVYAAYRLRPSFRGMSAEQQSLDRYRMAIDPFRRLIVIGIAALLGLFGGLAASGEWRTWLQWRNKVSFGVEDPQFHKDVSFFAMTLPWWRFVIGFLFAVVILALIATVATHYLYGGIRLQSQGERVTPAAAAHLSVLLGLFVLLKAVAYWLDRYGLAVASERFVVSGWTGLRYRDVNALLPAKTMLAAIALICAILFFANVVRRTWLLPGIGFGLLVLSAILIGGVYPAIVQQFQVKPSERQLEAKYINRNIEATRAAYGLGGVDIKQYNAQTTATEGQLRDDADTTASIRLMDPAVVSPTFIQDQQIRGFYEFPDTLDVDRYKLDGQTRDVVVGVRELDQSGIPANQRNWINDHLVYTHGFGFVAARGNTREATGHPSYVESDIPPKGTLGEFQPRVYYGELSPSYSIVGAPGGSAQAELDYPDDAQPNGQANTTYAGNGGVKVGSFFNKLLYAVKYRDEKILLSSGVNKDSRILYVRNPRERVEKVAPWLTVDSNTYPAIVDGKLVWIIDGYTTTSGYPYSSRRTLGDVTETSLTTENRSVIAPQDTVNYIRNSVKATVDAYDGTVTLYQWDQSDPVLKMWMKAFPGTVKPYTAITPGLLAHLRYPEDLFKVQRDLLAQYHVIDPTAFYSGQDFWRVPTDPTGDGDQPPYYLTIKMPDQDAATFSLTSTLVPTNRQNLAAFVAVNANPGADYGKLRVLELPRNTVVPGPAQVQNNFRSNTDVSSRLNLLTRGGQSTVRYGNLLTLPVGGGLLYVEPVYVEGTGNASFPLLRLVLVSFGDKIAISDTLQGALNSIFGQNAGADTGEQPPQGGSQPPPSNEPPNANLTAQLDAALSDAQAAYDRGQAALKEGDFAAYGTAQKDLAAALRRAADLSRRLSTTSTTPTSSSSPTSSTASS
jgi:uncharacterized protein